MALSDEERKFFRTRLEAGDKPENIAAQIKAQRGQAAPAPDTQPYDPRPAPRSSSSARMPPRADSETSGPLYQSSRPENLVALKTGPGDPWALDPRRGTADTAVDVMTPRGEDVMALDKTKGAVREMAGVMAGGGAGAALGKAVGAAKLAGGASALGRIGGAALEGGTAGAGASAGAALAEDRTPTADELGTGALTGAAAGAGVRAAGEGIAKFAKGAAERQLHRAAERIGEGATKLRRGQIQKDPDVLDVLREHPSVRAAAGNDAKLLPAVTEVREKASERLNKIYQDRDAASAVAQTPASAEALESADQARQMATKARATAQAQREAFLRANPSPTNEQVAAEAAQRSKLLRWADVLDSEAGQLASTPAAEARPAGASARDVVSNMDRTIAKLAKGDASDRAVGQSLQGIRDEFEGAHGGGIVPVQKLRAEQSAYQKLGYGKAMPGDSAATARIEAHRLASKDVGDVVVNHVTGMDYEAAKKAAATDPNSIAGQLFRANRDVKVANKIEAAIQSRAGSNPGAPHRLSALMHGAVLAGGGIGAVMHHGPGPALAAGAALLAPRLPRLIDAAASKLAPAIAEVAKRNPAALSALVRRARDENWSADRLAEEIGSVK